MIRTVESDSDTVADGEPRVAFDGGCVAGSLDTYRVGATMDPSDSATVSESTRAPRSLRWRTPRDARAKGCGRRAKMLFELAIEIRPALVADNQRDRFCFFALTEQSRRLFHARPNDECVNAAAMVFTEQAAQVRCTVPDCPCNRSYRERTIVPSLNQSHYSTDVWRLFRPRHGSRLAARKTPPQPIVLSLLLAAAVDLGDLQFFE